jgi:hypothetical protein
LNSVPLVKEHQVQQGRRALYHGLELLANSLQSEKPHPARVRQGTFPEFTSGLFRIAAFKIYLVRRVFYDCGGHSGQYGFQELGCCEHPLDCGDSFAFDYFDL